MNEDNFGMYRLKSGVNPFEFIDTVRDEMRFVRDGLLAEAVSELAVDMVDDADFSGSERPNMPLLDAFRLWCAVHHGSDQPDDATDPYRFSYYVAPAADPDRYLVLVHYREEQMKCVFADMDEVEDYDWWPDDVSDDSTATDRLEGLSEEQWNERGADWAPYYEHLNDPTGVMVCFRPTEVTGVASTAMSLRSGDDSLAVRWAPGRKARSRRLAREFLVRHLPGEVSDHELVNEMGDVIESRLAEVDSALLGHGLGDQDMDGLFELLSAVADQREN